MTPECPELRLEQRMSWGNCGGEEGGGRKPSKHVLRSKHGFKSMSRKVWVTLIMVSQSLSSKNAEDQKAMVVMAVMLATGFESTATW